MSIVTVAVIAIARNSSKSKGISSGNTNSSLHYCLSAPRTGSARLIHRRQSHAIRLVIMNRHKTRRSLGWFCN